VMSFSSRKENERKIKMNKISQIAISLFSVMLMFLPIYADGTHPRGVKLDGTVGNADQLSLPGPDYDIKAEAGYRHPESQQN